MQYEQNLSLLVAEQLTTENPLTSKEAYATKGG